MAYAKLMAMKLPIGSGSIESTVRCVVNLRLHEAGIIKSTPQKIIAQGTDWRFFNELKKELKG